MSAPDPERIPVIVGVGEVIDRPATPSEGLEPMALMAEALRRADLDAGSQTGLLSRLDSLDVVNLASWRYSDLARQLSDQLGVSPRHAVYNEVGGESPVRLIHEAALRIARGEAVVAAVVGAEAQSTAGKARKSGVDLPWTPFAKDGPKVPRGTDIVHPMATALGLSQPVSVYPMYDAASANSWGQTPAEALRESGEIWSRYAAVAAVNPTSWTRRASEPQAITTPTPDNRLIAWPYTKLMVANPMVNQGAAILLTSLAQARAAGIADDQMIHVLGGAAANEPRDFMARDQLTHSHAQDAVLERVRELAGEAGFAALELYSCFPTVPKMARRSLGLGDDVEPTVTGGLTFFGAPLSNYMTHAAAAMVRRLRTERGKGLVYGQGEFVTKHHALVLSSSHPDNPIDPNYSVQAQADVRRGPSPVVVEPAPGPATVETFTILYERDGSVLHGVVMLRTDAGERTLCRVPADDIETLAVLTNPSVYPIGRRGLIARAEDGLTSWRFA